MDLERTSVCIVGVSSLDRQRIAPFVLLHVPQIGVYLVRVPVVAPCVLNRYQGDVPTSEQVRGTGDYAVVWEDTRTVVMCGREVVAHRAPFT